MKVNVLILWFAFTAFFTERIFYSTGSIINAMYELLFLKGFESSVERSFICPFKFRFKVTKTYGSS